MAGRERVSRLRPVTLEDAKSDVRATLANALASALVCGFDEAEQRGRPLTQLQREDVLSMAFGAYADGVVEAEKSLEGAALIEQARRQTSVPG
jgi:hypothetical protein